MNSGGDDETASKVALRSGGPPGASLPHFGGDGVGTKALGGPYQEARRRKYGMVDTTVHTLGAIFAIIGGTSAGLLALLFWRAFPDSPLGAVIALLSATMSGMTVYHVVLFVLQPDALLLDGLRSAVYTIVAIFLWLVIATHRRIDDSAARG